jgi:hypothetical protein
MATKFIEIYDPNKRNQIIEENLKLRKKLKNKFDEQGELQNQVIQSRQELFKPIIESNEKTQNQLVKDRDKIVDVLNNFNQLQVTEKPTEKQQLAIEPKQNENITVSNLIANYLQDLTNRSNAGYSILYDSENKCYTIGDQIVEIDNNSLKIYGKVYNATNGLLELLTKKSLNLTLITDEDKKFYKQILDDSNAIYRNFDSTQKYLNSNSSDMWKFIKSEYLTKKGSSLQRVQILPSNGNSLIEQLQLSLASYKAGNNGEYNKINAIIDELLKIKVFKKRDLTYVYKTIGL